MIVSDEDKETASRVLIVGLDCAEPSLIFDRWHDLLPTFGSIMNRGVYGRLRSTVPPITVPAWASMVTSKDPGQLGFYGFRNRVDYSCDRMGISTSKAIHEETIWDILSRLGKRVSVVGVPQTYPPKPVNGQLVTCFLTPSTQNQFTYPANLKDEIVSLVGDYMLDIPNFRTEDKERLLGQIYDMTRQRFRLVKTWLVEKPWDFFMFVDMGTDRIHHGFWHYHDPQHPKHEPGNSRQNVIRDYYIYLDQEIGEILDLVDDDTTVLIVSDHGAKSMLGGIAINEWLQQEGYLTLQEKAQSAMSLDEAEIDWPRTKVWGAGGYYGRIFLNVEDREPQGVIAPEHYESFREELAIKIEAMTDEQGRPLGNRVFKPEDVYRECRNIPPDLIVYFGDLAWRSVGSVGLGKVYTHENDTGPDEANHAEEGIFMLYRPGQDLGGKYLSDLSLLDVAPTALRLLGIDVPPDMGGRVVQY